MKKLGIVAGGGKLPKQLIDKCKKEGRPYVLAALKKNASKDIAKGEECLWIRFGEAGKCLEYFKSQGVEEVVLIGFVKRPSLFDLRPDAYSLKFLKEIGFSAFGDNNLLTKVINYIEKDGMKIIGVHEVLDNLTVPAGVLGKITPDEQAKKDIEYGSKIALGIGNLDIGQSVIVQQGIVLGVEGVEGTDNLIKRCKKLSRPGLGGILVKIKKPNQEKRADLPTIGCRTLVNLKKSGFRGVAIQANYTLIVDKEALIKKADDLGLFIEAIDLEDNVNNV
ncbi:MAG: UDP-2,3-diacylglucosamine diphosphatase LpxI [Alphaproteobacteria bacterium]|nr:UDP-2,3-diacylglucosamine diphosphatase LpxI [Alphaproteobacteria bacterium]